MSELRRRPPDVPDDFEAAAPAGPDTTVGHEVVSELPGSAVDEVQSQAAAAVSIPSTDREEVTAPLPGPQNEAPVETGSERSQELGTLDETTAGQAIPAVARPERNDATSHDNRQAGVTQDERRPAISTEVYGEDESREIKLETEAIPPELPTDQGGAELPGPGRQTEQPGEATSGDHTTAHGVQGQESEPQLQPDRSNGDDAHTSAGDAGGASGIVRIERAGAIRQPAEVEDAFEHEREILPGLRPDNAFEHEVRESALAWRAGAENSSTTDEPLDEISSVRDLDREQYFVRGLPVSEAEYLAALAPERFEPVGETYLDMSVTEFGPYLDGVSLATALHRREIIRQRSEPSHANSENPDWDFFDCMGVRESFEGISVVYLNPGQLSNYRQMRADRAELKKFEPTVHQVARGAAVTGFTAALLETFVSLPGWEEVAASDTFYFGSGSAVLLGVAMVMARRGRKPLVGERMTERKVNKRSKMIPNSIVLTAPDEKLPSDIIFSPSANEITISTPATPVRELLRDLQQKGMNAEPGLYGADTYGLNPAATVRGMLEDNRNVTAGRGYSAYTYRGARILRQARAVAPSIRQLQNTLRKKPGDLDATIQLWAQLATLAVPLYFEDPDAESF